MIYRSVYLGNFTRSLMFFCLLFKSSKKIMPRHSLSSVSGDLVLSFRIVCVFVMRVRYCVGGIFLVLNLECRNFLLHVWIFLVGS